MLQSTSISLESPKKKQKKKKKKKTKEREREMKCHIFYKWGRRKKKESIFSQSINQTNQLSISFTFFFLWLLL